KPEYPSYGTTDYREPAFQILLEDGSRITNFEYNGHQIFKGKKPLDGLPATYVEHDDEAESIEISLYDKLIDGEIKLLYTVYEDYNVITRSARFINHGKENFNISRALSASVDFFDRSEEHTSELQSRFDLVCRLLLVKKK